MKHFKFVMSSLQENRKIKARTALQPFINGSYAEAVKNPILLLNYLYQHEIVPQPMYDIRPHPEKQFLFIALCTVGDIKTSSEGSSKKEAKTKVARMFLDMLLNDEEMDVAFADNENDFVSLREKTYSLEYENMIADSGCNIKYFSGSKWHSITPFVVTESTAKSNSLSLIKHRTSRRRSIRYNKKKFQHEINSQMVEPMIIAEAQCEEISGTGQCNFKSFSNKIPLHSDLLSSWHVNKPSFRCRQTNRCVESESSVNVSNGNNLEALEQVPKEINSVTDYFDPFLRLRPPVVKLNSFSSVINEKIVYQTAKELEFNDKLEWEKKKLCLEQKELCPEQKVKLEVNKNIPVKLSSEENITPELHAESSKLVDKVKNKTPFQLLYEKSVRNFKRIPRCRIQDCDDGFMCTLVLGNNTATGKGDSKKKSKMNAAENLLNQLENLESS